ncbi:DUF397 domain-containing protein [Streptomyces sp. NPDC002187]|uniref:DUF397 domain-containing protein n=1 Tax=Streptomyces sp. NPDC002187 TaxID=3364637 RepID=UPI0036A8E660
MEVATTPSAAHIRDSRNPHGPRIALAPGAWAGSCRTSHCRPRRNDAVAVRVHAMAEAASAQRTTLE